MTKVEREAKQLLLIDGRMQSLMKTRVYKDRDFVDGDTLLEVNGVKVKWHDNLGAYSEALAEQAAGATE